MLPMRVSFLCFSLVSTHLSSGNSLVYVASRSERRDPRNEPIVRVHLSFRRLSPVWSAEQTAIAGAFSRTRPLGQHPPAGSKIFCGPPHKYYQTPTHGEVRISVRGNHPCRCALSLFSYAFGIEKNVDGWHLIWISNPPSNQFHVQTASPLSITRNLHFRSSSYSALTRSHSCFLQSFRHRNERASVIVVHDIPAYIYVYIYIHTFLHVYLDQPTPQQESTPPWNVWVFLEKDHKPNKRTLKRI